MNSIVKLHIWLKDGSIFKGWTLKQADIKVNGLPFDFSVFEKLDDAYLYTADGAKIYRERVTGTLEVIGPGLAGALKLTIDEIQEVLRGGASAGN